MCARRMWRLVVFLLSGFCSCVGEQCVCGVWQRVGGGTQCACSIWNRVGGGSECIGVSGQCFGGSERRVCRSRFSWPGHFG